MSVRLTSRWVRWAEAGCRRRSPRFACSADRHRATSRVSRRSRGTQLGLHAKPVGFLNVGGYFDPLFVMIERMVAEGFLDASYRAALILEDDIDALLRRFENFSPPQRKSYV